MSLARVLRRWFGAGGSAAAVLSDQEWQQALRRLPFLKRLDPATGERVRRLAPRLLATKQISGAAGLTVEPSMAHVIAVQAVLPVNRIGLRYYDAFSEIIVYPSEFVVERDITDEQGLVWHQREALSGEAMLGGPVVLSWPDASNPGEENLGYNVVIHEFAHKLDLADGEADGCPPLSALERGRWINAIEAAYADFCKRLDKVEASIPSDLDPESEAANSYWYRLPLDPYAGTNIAEFFAVASEVWFVASERVTSNWPALAKMFEQLYGPGSVAGSPNRSQDPR